MRHKEWELCELSALRLISVWHLHCCCCCWCCCCWACHMRVSVDIFNQERFHIWKMLMKKLKKKEKEKLYVRWEGLNLTSLTNKLKWIVEENHASNEKFSSVNLICTKQANMCQQTLTIIQQPFQKLKAQPWKERERWCHKLNSY